MDKLSKYDIASKLYPLCDIYSRLYLILTPKSKHGFTDNPIVAYEHFLLFPHKSYPDHALLFIKDVPYEDARMIFDMFCIHREAYRPSASFLYHLTASLIDVLGGFIPAITHEKF